MYTFPQFLKAIQDRKDRTDADSNPRPGVSLASDFLATFAGAMGGTKGLSKHFGNVKEDQFANAIKRASEILVFHTGDQVVTGGKTTGGTFGTLEAKDVQPTPNSVLDFECVLTSKRKDRDGDILHPDGADIDPKMPLLWQHMPFEPLGKYVGTTLQNGELVKGRCAIADTALGRDAAVLTEFGALRISHGFQPTKFEPQKVEKEGDFNGWEVFKYHMMEVSLVSVPSNTDAVITALSREKLHHPAVKEWAGVMNAARSKFVNVGQLPGGGNVVVNLNLGDAITKALGGNPAPTPTPPPPAKKTPAAPPPKKDDPPPTDPPATDPPPAEGEGEGEQKPVLMSDISDIISGVAGMSGLPDEAANRLTVVEGQLDGLATIIETANEKIGEAAGQGDIAGIIAGVKDVIEDAIAKLNGIAEELGRIKDIADMPGDANTKIGEALGMIQTVNDALSAMVSSASDVQTDDAGGGEGGEPLDPLAPSDSDGKGYSKAAQYYAGKLLGLMLMGKRLPPVMIRNLRGEFRTQLQPAG